jgi:L-aspartate oxidase
VVHAGGAATGAEIERALVAAVRGTASEIHEGTFALELIVEGGRCVGVSATTDGVTTFEVRARHTLLATGGAGQLFAVTTNPPVATGDGVAMGLRIGAAVADLEFFQFHPTALDHPAMPRALLSEALRGHGALLRDATGQRFVDELLPRDVVSRAMTKIMADQHIDHVWLDATGLDQFGQRFPTIAAELAMAGLDASDDWLPVAPAAHHQCGGIVTDLFGATTIPGLWGAGEVTCSGVHGANRLASNSLLEGMVFGGRVVDAIAGGVDGPSVTGAMRSVLGDASVGMPIGGRRLGRPPELLDGPAEGRGEPQRVASLRHELQRSMTVFAGVLRSAESLAQARARVAETLAEVPRDSTDPATRELRNLAEVGAVLLWSAEHRTESRGAHTRTDHPETDESMRLRLVV